MSPVTTAILSFTIRYSLISNLTNNYEKIAVVTGDVFIKVSADATSATP